MNSDSKNAIGMRLKAIRETLNMSQSLFGESLGLKQGSYSDIETGKDKSKITKQTELLLCYRYNVNIEYLYRGEGNMFAKKEVCITKEDDYSLAVSLGMKLVPEVSFRFSAGDKLITSSEDIIRYWGLPDCTGEECVVTVDGLSMLPIIPPGAKVLLKPMGFSLENPNMIPFGEVFGVIVEDQHTGMYHGHIKKIRRHKELPGKYWVAQSFNPDFDDFDISLSQVRGLWIVKKHIVDDFK